MSRREWLIGASVAALAMAASPAAADWGAAAAQKPSPPLLYAVPPPPPPPPPRGLQRRAILRIGFISEEDYPEAALAQLAEGMVTTSYVIGASGRVENCLVVGSSGHPDLDRVSCEIITARFVFMPALDAEGRAVEETRQQRIRWQLPDMEPECDRPCPPAPPMPPPIPVPPPAPRASPGLVAPLSAVESPPPPPGTA